MDSPTRCSSEGCEHPTQGRQAQFVSCSSCQNAFHKSCCVGLSSGLVPEHWKCQGCNFAAVPSSQEIRPRTGERGKAPVRISPITPSPTVTPSSQTPGTSAIHNGGSDHGYSRQPNPQLPSYDALRVQEDASIPPQSKYLMLTSAL